jgi:hypothetical protein
VVNKIGNTGEKRLVRVQPLQMTALFIAAIGLSVFIRAWIALTSEIRAAEKGPILRNRRNK